MKYYRITFYLLFASLLTQSCTKDTGNVTVNYQEATAIYGSLDDIRTSDLNQSPKQINNPGKIFIGNDYVLIGEEGQGVHVVNNNDKSAPFMESFISIPGNREFVVFDDVLYAESYYDMIKVDVTNPTNAKLLARSEFAIQDKYINENGQVLIGFSYADKEITIDQNDDFYNEIIGDQLVYLDYAKNIIPNSAVPSSFAGNSAKQFGSVNRISKVNDHIYVVSKNNLIILNDSDFASRPIIYKDLKEDMETVFPHDNNLFIGTRTSMDIFNISNPTTPSNVFEFEHATSCDPVLPSDNVAYVTLRTGDFAECPGNTNALVVVDVSDLSNAKVKEEIPMNSPYGMAIINNELYVGEGINGLKIYDITDRLHPQLIMEDKNIEAYDIIADPQDPTNIFVAGPKGLNQFEILDNRVLDIKSSLDY